MLSRADVHEPYEKYSYFIGEEHSDCFVRAKHTSFFKEKGKERRNERINLAFMCISQARSTFRFLLYYHH